MRRLNGTWETWTPMLTKKSQVGRTTRARVRMRSFRDGTARSSDEVLYKRMEPRGCATEPNSTVNPKGGGADEQGKTLLDFEA